MATRTFLTEPEISEAKEHLREQGEQKLSLWLEQKLENKLASHPQWRNSRPIRLGSWARNELCAKSDIDLLFIGPESAVKALVDHFQTQGIKLRYRMPENMKDWTEGVQAFDVLALLSAKTFFASEEPELLAQIKIIQSRGQAYKKELFRTMRKEREDRAQRYDSIANYLEPNLKYGHGGLRDLDQGLVAARLLTNEFQFSIEAVARLNGYKSELLKIRHYLHLNGAGDVLIGSMQKEVADFFAYDTIQAFMGHVEALLSEISFYADWIIAAVQANAAKVKMVESVNANTLSEALTALKKDSSILMQQQVRGLKIKISEKKQIGKKITTFVNSNMNEGFLDALFRSKLLSQLVPSLERLTGHVQHDQYHRYSVDAHTLQAMREVIRLKKKPRRLGRLSVLAKELTSREWEVLLWSALYHDLGKGLKGDHSQEGCEIAKRDLVGMGMSLQLTTDVSWMVKNHLIMSHAAFRQNPQSSATWAELFRRGVKGRRIIKLALFTAIDIRATNPEAWNEWKERLLFELAEVLRSSKASRLSDLLESAEKTKVRIDKKLIDQLDPHVVESVPKQILLKDFSLLKKKSSDLEPLVIMNRKKEIWVRLHARHDRPGVFLSFVRAFHSSGLSVQEAFVQTFAEVGVYDWFKVKSSKSLKAIQALMGHRAASLKSAQNLSNIDDNELSAVSFSIVDLVTQDEQSAVLSFRGKDQRGALLVAARALNEAGLEIVSAKVHTWGRQIDDVFTVKKADRFDQLIGAVRQRCLPK